MALPSAIFKMANAAASGKSGEHAANLAARRAGNGETSISRIRIKSEARDLQYIVGARLKELPKDLKERILDLAVYVWRNIGECESVSRNRSGGSQDRATAEIL